MSYDYAIQRQNIFTEDGQRLFLQVRDSVKEHIEISGAVRFDKIKVKSGGYNSFDLIACVDRLVELGEIVELPRLGYLWQQYKVYTTPETHNR